MIKFNTRSFVRYVHVYQAKKLSKGVIESAATHDLLQWLGFVKQTQSGLVHWLPMGLRTLNKITHVIKYRMNTYGRAHEVSLSTLSPRALWLRTGRWGNSELFKLKDSKGAEYCLAPTCEEEITSLIGAYVSSYKDLPLLAYQVTRKYRDERRPRGGLLRGREFLMKDGYSFDVTKESAIETFNRMNKCYDLIFQDLRVPFVSAWADSGDIGGDMSKEYHYLHETGEDVLMKCTSCESVSNVETCNSYPVKEGEHGGDVDVRYALNKERDTLLCLYYPKGRTLNWNHVKGIMDDDIDLALRETSNDKILEIFSEKYPEDEAMFASVIRVMDCRLNSHSNFPDFPLKQYLKSNFAQLTGESLVDAVHQEICGECKEGSLEAAKSIEVGHTFYLGTKYSERLDGKFMTKDNNEQLMEMGCYGIGVSRLVGAIAQVTRDEKGLRWPKSSAPYEISLCAAQFDSKVEEARDLLSSHADELWIDARDKVSLGRKISQSHCLGIPLCVIVGNKHWPHVEIEVRGRRVSDQWHAKYNQLAQEYQWTMLPASNDAFEKHRVHKNHLSDVAAILLTDM
ncbi:LAFE_0B02036g1_1 [Lachancea fermentati]|uniref:proline--tRNA ligase n=1 Tax=Lachancea fermentati TaxID=4955 RepID=A0A1G4M7F3_LACFM|nr:LAFE_0B02036g1_1 [Lachancea fermentati]